MIAAVTPRLPFKFYLCPGHKPGHLFHLAAPWLSVLSPQAQRSNRCNRDEEHAVKFIDHRYAQSFDVYITRNSDDAASEGDGQLEHERGLGALV